MTSRRRERGYATVFSALIIVPLMGFAALAVDVGSWYARAQELSAIADSAALAGVVELPDVTAAEAAAQAAAGRNGIDLSDPDMSMTVTQLDTNRLEVVITDANVELYFAGVFRDDISISRRAVAEFTQEVDMGSPENFLGNDPLLGEAPNLWLSGHGTGTPKTHGDQFHTVTCSSSVDCTGGLNDDYDDVGYFFEVDVASVSGSLGIDVFDPATVGDSSSLVCNSSFLFTNGSASSQSFYTSDPTGLGSFNAGRYERGTSGDGADWCLGDRLNETGGETTYIVRGPDSTPFTIEDNPVLCWATFGDVAPTSTTDLVNRLQSSTTDQPLYAGGSGAPSANSLTFNDHWRNWVRLCDISSPQVGQYYVQVRSNADTTDPTVTDSSNQVSFYNNYSLRVGFGTPGSSGYDTGVTLTANGRLPIYVNRPGGDGIPSEFFIARVLPVHAGETLDITLFDLGDNSDMSIRFEPPVDSNVSSFSSCVMQIRQSGSTSTLNSSNCYSTHTSESKLKSSAANGSMITAAIDIPPGYTCNDSVATGCWVTVEMTFDGSPADRTTWAAALTGDPIRLAE